MVGDDMKLTEQEKRIKLAEAARWKGISEQFLVGYAPWRTEPYSDRVNACPVDELECFPLDPLPDYFNDLNAVHELEQQTWSKEWNMRDDFCDHLALIIDPVHGYRGLKAIDALQATAAQRCEALGLALNIW
jgi:hypothetical protein